MSFTCVYQYLSHLAGITVKLQKRSLDIIDAHELIAEVTATYVGERNNVDISFNHIYQQSVRIAEIVSIAPEMPRVTGRQQHRSNPSSFSVEDYFKKAVAIPLLDHIITSMKDRFSAAAIVASSLLGDVPSVCCSREVNTERAIEKYKDDLPSPELISTELRRWKARYSGMPVELRPNTPAAAIKDCDSDLYPNVRVLLQIACTLPVTSCECERSASALRRLHNYMRASMGKSRLSGLALLHIHYDMDVDLDEVITRYAHLHPRRLSSALEFSFKPLSLYLCV